MQFITELGRVAPANTLEKDLSVQKLVDDEIRTVLAISFRNEAVLSKHKAAEPITVLCLSGRAEFRAGEGFSDKAELLPGTLIALDANIEHEVTAMPDAQIVVTKFKR